MHTTTMHTKRITAAPPAMITTGKKGQTIIENKLRIREEQEGIRIMLHAGKINTTCILHYLAISFQTHISRA